MEVEFDGGQGGFAGVEGELVARGAQAQGVDEQGDLLGGAVVKPGELEGAGCGAGAGGEFVVGDKLDAAELVGGERAWICVWMDGWMDGWKHNLVNQSPNQMHRYIHTQIKIHQPPNQLP